MGEFDHCKHVKLTAYFANLGVSQYESTEVGGDTHKTPGMVVKSKRINYSANNQRISMPLAVNPGAAKFCETYHQGLWRAKRQMRSRGPQSRQWLPENIRKISSVIASVVGSAISIHVARSRKSQILRRVR